jgi:MFS family permease
MAISGYNMGNSSMMRDLHSSRLQAITGFDVYSLGFGVVPLVTASFSEEFGRRPLYLITVVGFNLMFIMIAL